MSAPSLQFRLARTPEEFEQIYRMNYVTFVEEIPQHQPNRQRRLVDDMLERSDCYVCLRDERVIGMVAVSGQRPFSLDRKLENLDQYLPEGCHPCEGRLLAVDPAHRRGLVFAGLMRCLLQYSTDNGHDLAVFSATETQWPMYLRVGCVPFGPLLGTEQARFRGMYITWELLPASIRGLLGDRRD